MDKNLKCRECGHFLAKYNMSNTHIGCCTACKPDKSGQEYIRPKDEFVMVPAGIPIVGMSVTSDKPNKNDDSFEVSTYSDKPFEYGSKEWFENIGKAFAKPIREMSLPASAFKLSPHPYKAEAEANQRLNDQALADHRRHWGYGTDEPILRDPVDPIKDDKIDLLGKPITMQDLEDLSKSLRDRKPYAHVEETQRFNEQVLAEHRERLKDIEDGTFPGPSMGVDVKMDTCCICGQYACDHLRSHEKPVPPPTLANVQEVANEVRRFMNSSSLRVTVNGKDIGKITGWTITKSMERDADTINLITEEPREFAPEKMSLSKAISEMIQADFDVEDRTLPFHLVGPSSKGMPIEKGTILFDVFVYGGRTAEPVGIAVGPPAQDGLVRVIIDAKHLGYGVAMRGSYNLDPDSVDQVLKGCCTIVSRRVKKESEED